MKNMNYKISIQLLKGLIMGFFGLALLMVSCKEDDSFDVTPVKFNVGASKTFITMTETVDFIDNSTDVASRNWTFPGGNPATSTNVSETVTYPDSGRFETTLEVNFNDGKSETRLFYIDVRPFVETNFTASATTTILSSEVTFTNLTKYIPVVNSFPDRESFESEKETWQWEFEGGVPATSTEENPVVLYPTVGTYKVKLTANRNYPANSDTEEKIGYINVVDVAVISPEAVYTCDFGSTLRLTYIEPLSAPTAAALAAFTINADGMAVEVTSLEIDPNDANSFIFNLANPITDGQSVTLTLDNSTTLTAVSGSLLAPLTDFIVENRTVNLFAGNMDFEIGAVGDFPADWGSWNPTQSMNNSDKYAIIADADAPSGSNVLSWSYDGSEDQWILDNKTPLTITEGEMYRVTFWAKSSVDGVPFDFRLIESGWAVVNNPDNFTLSTTWQQFSFDFEGTTDGNMNRKVWWQTIPSTDVFDMFIDDINLYSLGCN